MMALRQNSPLSTASQSGSRSIKGTRISRPSLDLSETVGSCGLEDLEARLKLAKAEEKRLKEECQELYSATEELDKDSAKDDKEARKLEKIIQAKQKTRDKLSDELHGLQLSNQNVRGEMVHAGASARVLDESFGPHYQELQLLLDDCNWDMDMVARLIGDRSKLEKKLDYLKNMANKNARAAQLAQMATENRELKTLRRGMTYSRLLAGVRVLSDEALHWVRSQDDQRKSIAFLVNFFRLREIQAVCPFADGDMQLCQLVVVVLDVLDHLVDNGCVCVDASTLTCLALRMQVQHLIADKNGSFPVRFPEEWSRDISPFALRMFSTYTASGLHRKFAALHDSIMSHRDREILMVHAEIPPPEVPHSFLKHVDQLEFLRAAHEKALSRLEAEQRSCQERYGDKLRQLWESCETQDSTGWNPAQRTTELLWRKDVTATPRGKAVENRGHGKHPAADMDAANLAKALGHSVRTGVDVLELIVVEEVEALECVVAHEAAIARLISRFAGFVGGDNPLAKFDPSVESANHAAPLQENNRLHAERAKLKKKVISETRNADMKAGRSRFRSCTEREDDTEVANSTSSSSTVFLSPVSG